MVAPDQAQVRGPEYLAYRTAGMDSAPSMTLSSGAPPMDLDCIFRIPTGRPEHAPGSFNASPLFFPGDIRHVFA